MSTRQAWYSILKSIRISSPTYVNINALLIRKMKESNALQGKLNSSGTIVQVDEIMLNNKFKSHRSCSTENKTDALCIVECNRDSTRVCVEVLPNEKASTILPFTHDHVVEGNTIHNDEHCSYISLRNVGFYHSTVCHKYNFVNLIQL